MNQKKIYLDLKCLFGVEKNYHICYITVSYTHLYDKSVNENGDEIRVLNKKETMLAS